MQQETKLLKITEAAKYAGVGRLKIDEAIRNRELKVYQLTKNSARIRVTDLEKWINSKLVKEL